MRQECRIIDSLIPTVLYLHFISSPLQRQCPSQLQTHTMPLGPPCKFQPSACGKWPLRWIGQLRGIPIITGTLPDEVEVGNNDHRVLVVKRGSLAGQRLSLEGESCSLFSRHFPASSNGRWWLGKTLKQNSRVGDPRKEIWKPTVCEVTE